MAQTKIKCGDFLYRTETRIARDGTRWTDWYRRDVVAIDDKGVSLGPVQKSSCLENSKPEVWTPWGGVFGSQTRVSNERMKTLDYQPRRNA